MLVRLLVVAMVVLVSAVSGFAQQEKPEFEISGGYSYQGFESQNMNGWQGSVGASLAPWLRLVGDFSGHYASESVSSDDFSVSADNSLYTYRFGPRFTKRTSDKWSMFAQTMFGGANLKSSAFTTTSGGTIDVSSSVNGFAMGLGGGLDIDATERVSIRLIHAEYTNLRVQGQNADGARLSFGLVYRFQ